MKKSLIVFILSTMVLLSGTVLTVFADNYVETEIFSPSTYLEYFDLSGPIDYAYDQNSDTHVICESKRIIVYRDEVYTTHDMSIYNITQIRFLNSDYLLFCSEYKIYYVYLNDWIIYETPIVTSYFDLIDNIIVTNPGNSFKIYTITFGETPIFTETISYTLEKNFTAISFISKTDWLCVNEGTLYRFNSLGSGSPAPIAYNLKDTRYSVYNNGVYYFTQPDGIYSVDIQTNVIKPLQGTTNEIKLKNLINPQGITYYNDKLYVCDSKLNAVSEFDPYYGFTNFAITSRSEGDGRVSVYATDLQTYNETVYALDGKQIKVFGDDGKPISLEMTGKAFSVIGDTILIANNQSLWAVKNSTSTQIGTTVFNDITAVTSFENNFYFINNILKESNTYAEIYQVTTDNLQKVVKVTTLNGYGEDICSDIFGKLYVKLSNNSAQSIVALADGNTTPEEIFTVSTDVVKILSIVPDFECNIYALMSNNKIIRIDETTATKEFTLKISGNLSNLSKAKDLAIVPSTNKMYALFEGVILKLDPDDLQIANPEEIKVPVDYTNDFNGQIQICNPLKEVKYFGVDLNSTLDGVFAYTGYATYLGEESFVVLHTDDKYTLICNENLTCIVRTKDVILNDLNYTDEQTSMYAVVDNFAYTYPVLTPYFRDFEVKGNEKVNVINTFDFNQVKYATIKCNDKTGYVAFSALKVNIACDNSPFSVESFTASSKGAKVYDSPDMDTVIGQISPYQSILVTGKIGNVYQVIYNDQTGYVYTEDIHTKGSLVIRNLLLVTAVIVAVVTTLIYLYRRKYGKLKDDYQK